MSHKFNSIQNVHYKVLFKLFDLNFLKKVKIKVFVVEFVITLFNNKFGTTFQFPSLQEGKNTDRM